MLSMTDDVMRDSPFKNSEKQSVFARDLQFASDEANLTQATDDPDEREDDELLWVVGEVHAEPSPEKRSLCAMLRMYFCATLHCKKRLAIFYSVKARDD